MSSDDICRVCIDAKADLILVENEALLKRILLVQHKLPQLKAIVQLRGDPPLSDKRRLYKSHKVRQLKWKLNQPILTVKYILICINSIFKQPNFTFDF